jgi:flagellar basal-body rod protein FlgG
MNDALYIAATGMQVQQLNVDTIANNLANVNTMGFKGARVAFTDLVRASPEAVQLDAGLGQLGAPLGTTPGLGAGVGVAGVTRRFDGGELKQTGSPLDLAIRGDGFLTVTLPDGSLAFTCGGTMKVSSDGTLTSSSGLPFKPGISVPANATELSVDAEGRVLATIPGQPGRQDLGQLELVRFANPSALVAQGGDVYRASEGSGEAMTVRPGEEGAGQLLQGYLETSNVRMVDEMVNLMVAQRAYEASAKVVQASDEMLGIINALRR